MMIAFEKAIQKSITRPFLSLHHISFLWENKGADWVEKTLGWSVNLVERPKKPTPEKVLMAWAAE